MPNYSRPPFALADGLKQQEIELLDWRDRLNEECYDDLVEFVKEHARTHVYQTGWDVLRGQSITEFVINWYPAWRR